LLRLTWPPGRPKTAGVRARAGVKVDLVEFDQYVLSGDEKRNAVELVPGWNHRLPPEAGVEIGSGSLYDDFRVTWAIEQFGGVSGRSVLEIGPMEASHTYMLERAGACVHAVEANKLAFLKCLVAKEILGLKARFSLAEINEWLRASSATYDLIFACGVLYHMRDPVTLLELLAQRTCAIFLWTHFATEEEIRLAEAARAPHLRREKRLGQTIRLVRRPYHGSAERPGFCGGVFDEPSWMPKQDLLDVLMALGFDDVRIAFEQLDHPYGPALSVFARKTSSP